LRLTSGYAVTLPNRASSTEGGGGGGGGLFGANAMIAPTALASAPIVSTRFFVLDRKSFAFAQMRASVAFRGASYKNFSVLTTLATDPETRDHHAAEGRISKKSVLRGRLYSEQAQRAARAVHEVE
jgi:hypothetical protein